MTSEYGNSMMSDGRNTVIQVGHWTDDLVRLGACPPAVEWAKDYASLDEAWAVCDRGDWMLWLAGCVGGGSGSDTRRQLTLAACGCARLLLADFEAVFPGDTRPRTAIETAERWARGEAGVSLAAVRTAADATYATYAAAAYAAYAATESAATTTAASAAAYVAARIARIAPAAKQRALRDCADIVRRHYPTPPVIRGVK